MINLIFKANVYEIVLVVEKRSYIATLKGRDDIISEGETIDDAVQGLFDCLETKELMGDSDE